MEFATISGNGRIRFVKNLGWILRNWKMVDYVSWNHSPDRASVCDGTVEFWLKDGRRFFSRYASFSVFLRWIDRPIYRHLCLWIRNQGKIMGYLPIGSNEFRKLRDLRIA